MEPISLAAIVVCALLAINVGGNNSAAEMGPAFGAEVRSKREAVLLIAIFSMIGAIIAGDKVVHTIGRDLFSCEKLAVHPGMVIVILFSAALIIGVANVLKIPIATAHAMVGSVTGAGLYYGCVNWDRIVVIVVWWLITPLFSLVISYLLGNYVYEHLKRWIESLPAQNKVQLLFRCFITVSGCYMAFSGGSNSLAKAVGPIVGAGIIDSTTAAVLGGMGMAVGAFIVGHRLLHTVGKGIAQIDQIKAALIEIVCGTIVLIASRAGMPVSLAEIITCSVIGFGCAHAGIRKTAQNKYVKTIYKFWPVCPLLTCMITFCIAKVIF
jgi:PiT family inorganic phosphate transporter/sulfate permease